MNDAPAILITGASTGFGYELARAASSRGDHAIAAMRDVAGRNAERARQLAAGGIPVVELDVTDDASVAQGVSRALEIAGRIDVLVNNAGFGMMGPLEAATIDDFRAQFETNVFGAQRMIRAVLPHMRERRQGLLLHVSSGAGRLAFPGGGLYCASKWALEAMGESLRYELAPLGIDSVIVEPGPYATDFAGRSLRFVSDKERATAYEAVRRGSRKRAAAIEQRDPAEVVRAILRLIDLPRGKRPTRVVVHPLAPALERLNAAQSAVANLMLEPFGVPELLENGV